MTEASTTALRIDRWLWCARFYKTRSLAAQAVKAGHVRINGQRSKPSREIKIGDSLTILRGLNEQDVEVRTLPARRGPAREAARCYLETPESLERGRLRSEQRAGAESARAPTAGRPDKRTRRLMRDRQRDQA
jgi:ribosome-associated heat shock protein Hsp15